MSAKLKLQLQLERILRAGEREERKALNYIGGYIRKTARNSMKRGTKGETSEPGKPPLAWTERYRNSIAYAYDKAARSVVIGGVAYSEKAIPGIIERGGIELVTNPKTGVQSVNNYRERPAMRLALDVAIEKAVTAAIKDFIRE